MVPGIALSFLSALVINAGNLMQKKAVDGLPRFSGRRPAHMLRVLISSKLWLAGAVASVCSLVMQVEAFSLAPIAVVQSIFCVGLVFLLIGSRVHFHEPFHRIEMTGMAIVLLGTLFVSLSLTGSDNSVGIDGSLDWVLTAAAVTAAAVAVAQLVARRRGRNSAVVMGVSSGLLYGVASLGTKGASTFVAKDGLIAAIPSVMTSPYPYMFVVFCALGILVFQTGLQKGRVGVIAPLNNVVASAYLVGVGMVVFDEPLPSDPVLISLRLGGFAGILAGSCLLAGGDSRGMGLGTGPVIEPDLGLGPVLEAEVDGFLDHRGALDHPPAGDRDEGLGAPPPPAGQPAS